ncbi:MAG: hypothetical protein ACREF7_00470, partial [Candidatus Saccharimonadales bacterium]
MATVLIVVFGIVSGAPSAAPKGKIALTSSDVDGSVYTSLSPVRLLDTRNGSSIGSGATISLTIADSHGVPSDATAVALNLTITGPTASSYLTAYAEGSTRPEVSNINFTANETIPNLTIVPLGSDGGVSFYNFEGSTNLLVDLEGYFSPAAAGSSVGTYVPLTPDRIVDTRAGSGKQDAGDTLGSGASINIQVTGEGGVPDSGVEAILANVAVTGTTAASYLTVYPQGESRPTVSNLNWTSGETIANRVLIPVSSSGEITAYNFEGSTNVIVDVDGYVTNSTNPPDNASLYYPITPTRLVDTRSGSGNAYAGDTIGSGDSLKIQVTGVANIPSGATAVAANATVTNTTAASYLTVYPGGSLPEVSDINWTIGQTISNLTIAALSSDGYVDAYNHLGSTNLLFDVYGYFLPQGTQAITWTSSDSSPTYGDNYTPTATSSSGLPVTITLDSTSTGCTLSSGVVTFTTLGTCVLDANQAGNSNWGPAAQA